MIIEMLTKTPWWVYLLFIYLLKIGYDEMEQRALSINKVIAIPILLFIISTYTLIISFRLSILTVSVHLSSLIIGSFIGWFETSRLHLDFDYKKNRIKISKTHSTLFWVIIMIAIQSFFAYSLTIDPLLAEDTMFELLMLSAYGIFTGLFIGRFFYIFYRKQND